MFTNGLLPGLKGKVCTVDMYYSLTVYVGRVVEISDDWMCLKQKDGTLRLVNLGKVQDIQIMPDKVQEQWREKE